MLRSVIAIVVSYVAVNIAIALLFLAATLALGIEGTLNPGEYWTSPTFNLIVFIGGAVVAFTGGMLCGRIARSWKPALWVAGAMLVFGGFRAVPNLNKPDPPARAPRVVSESETDYAMAVLTEMAKVGKEPNWFAFTVPLVGAGAFVLGARTARTRPATAPPQ